MLRASQINGCGFCVDHHTKEASAAGETSVRLHLVWSPPGACPPCSPRPSGPHWRWPRRAPGSPTPTTACPASREARPRVIRRRRRERAAR
ncbi:carboxymuconolactone decarboxylase family protein [Planotetraspora sp. GP83]|uniref:carboxymuconolactone decarboxylase family protein n=1 Tax=Planotetraspora sp. GP83 TaxID=3156264 RepID=UPI00351817BA